MLWRSVPGRHFGLRDGAHTSIDLSPEHEPKWRLKHSFRQIRNVFGDAFAQKEHGKVVGEVVAVMSEDY